LSVHSLRVTSPIQRPDMAPVRPVRSGRAVGLWEESMHGRFFLPRGKDPSRLSSMAPCLLRTRRMLFPMHGWLRTNTLRRVTSWGISLGSKSDRIRTRVRCALRPAMSTVANGRRHAGPRQRPMSGRAVWGLSLAWTRLH